MNVLHALEARRQHAAPYLLARESAAIGFPERVGDEALAFEAHEGSDPEGGEQPAVGVEIDDVGFSSRDQQPVAFGEHRLGVCGLVDELLVDHDVEGCVGVVRWPRRCSAAVSAAGRRRGPLRAAILSMGALMSWAMSWGALRCLPNSKSKKPGPVAISMTRSPRAGLAEVTGDDAGPAPVVIGDQGAQIVGIGATELFIPFVFDHSLIWLWCLLNE